MLDSNVNLIGSPLSATAEDLRRVWLCKRRAYPSMLGEGWGGWLKSKYTVQRSGLEDLLERFLRRKKYTEHNKSEHWSTIDAVWGEITRRSYYGGGGLCRHFPVGSLYGEVSGEFPADKCHAAWINGVYVKMTALSYARRFLGNRAARSVIAKIRQKSAEHAMEKARAEAMAARQESAMRAQFLRRQFMRRGVAA